MIPGTIKIDEVEYVRKGTSPSGTLAACNGIEELVGRSFFFRTVTHHLTGRITKVWGNFLVLENAAWIADSGRFTQAIRDGVLSEVEPVGDAIINLSTVTDMFPWIHPLPTVQK